MVRPLLKNYYSLLGTALSLFQAITGGVDWHELMNPIINNISPIQALPFIVYIAFSVLALLNIVTGVFVESALISAKEDKERDMRQRMLEMFLKGDVDKSGTISWAEFMQMIKDKMNKKSLKTMGIDVTKMTALFTLLATDTGEVNINTLISGCQRLQGPAKALDLEMLAHQNKQMWSRFHDHSSKVETALSTLTRYLLELGNAMDKDLQAHEQFLHQQSTKGHDSRASTGPSWLSWSELEAEADRNVEMYSKQDTTETLVRRDSQELQQRLGKRLSENRGAA
eukprot:gnl/TRDRNA2_/TRDRNA2_149807_c3_seq1.p1 gnl/TRDRNA2_/TRDRNA2_149807_c3~~gnl/TRDRNA2_/TRDRNA2_149807_c3_seq1.p1  ORF type:complete len:321 (+),score=61.97 gnl/TRDRNA2_/TRDRNA2_149807_c3_seq1:117-965(+)